MAEFKIEEGMTLQEAVFQALGAASVCWENPGGAGVFDSDRCKRIGDELVAALKAGRLPDEGSSLAVKPSRWGPLGLDGRPAEQERPHTPPPPPTTDAPAPTVGEHDPREVDGG